ncbi:DUF309 domain-containing protein [Brevibacillus panacihumi]|uniref:DUF309 domain-containing protein n=1 Tax=Brevibacillus panacihumi TaxID=497735 RepID=UPI003CFCB907
MYPEPYLEYLIQFHAERDYFECHEILEEYWKSAPANERQPVWVGLIQIAVALYHHRRGNFNGAIKMLSSAIHILDKQQMKLQELGLDSIALLRLLEQRLEDLHQSLPYQRMDLPIVSQALRECYQQACRQRQLPEFRSSDMTNEFLLNKHTLRDRQEVREERMRQLKLRELRRSNGSK